jgi:endonuclease/exonuclease/phosphatase family metal-dependent hydrolase
MWFKILFFIFFIIIIWIFIQKNIKERYIPENYINHIKEDIKDKDLSIVTYNIQKFPWALKSLGDEEISKIIKTHSIILLQECFNEAYDSLESHYPDYYICRGNLKGINMMNSGLVVMSKYPIIDVKFNQYKSSNPWSFDYFSEKGFLTAFIKIGDKSIKVINTHLQSSDFHRYDKYALSQLKELMEYIEEIKMNGDEYIVGGDFNIDINDIKNIKNINNIENIKYPSKPTIYINLTTSHTSNVYKEGYEPFIFDYFIVSKSLNISNLVVINSDYSDHNPVSCVFK